MTLLANRLTYRCVIQRDANAGQTDEWGAALPPSWVDHLTDQPCALWMTSGREAVLDSTTVVVVDDSRLILPAGTDVTAADQVGDVTLRGVTVLAGPTQIRSVLVHQDHVELVLVKVA